MSNEGFIILGNQLFPLDYIKKYKSCHFFMAEDYELCTYFKFHKHKLIFFLASMRSYRDLLIKKGFNCDYQKLDEQKKTDNYEKKLKLFIKQNKIKKLKIFEIPDSFFKKRIIEFCDSNKIELDILNSPMFMTDKSLINEYFLNGKKAFFK
jgi:deoxyribodipyrimidine photolyase-related protein